MMETIPPLSVLVVDDQIDVAESTAELLTLYGCEVRVATSGSEALRIAAECIPDVVLLDIGMPDLSGWEVARQLRDQAIGKQPLVVAVTGFGTLADRQHSADSGIDLHLTKPVNPVRMAELLDKIRRMRLEVESA